MCVNAKKGERQGIKLGRRDFVPSTSPQQYYICVYLENLSLDFIHILS